MGARHPLIVTQYDLKEIDHEGGLFPDARQALMRGTHERRRAPEPGKQYALLVDVAGEDEEQRGSAEVLERDQLANKKRDATAITVVEMGPGDQWSYLVRDRSLFLGVPQTALYERINALVAHWSARWLVVDAAGVGGGRVPVVMRGRARAALAMGRPRAAGVRRAGGARARRSVDQRGVHGGARQTTQTHRVFWCGGAGGEEGEAA